MINIAICDDEKKTVRELESLTKSFFNQSGTETDIVGFYDGASLLESASATDYDVIFLDIKMSAPDGMETARKLREMRFKGYIIFVTVLEDYVFDAFEVSAYDYLVKPVENEKFLRTMSRLQKQLESSFITIQRDGQNYFLNLDDILYCEVLNRKIYIHTLDRGTFDYYGKIEDLEKRLTGSNRNFFRCHRSFLVNLAHLNGFGHGYAFLADGEKIPVSRLRKDAFETAVSKYIAENPRGLVLPQC